MYATRILLSLLVMLFPCALVLAQDAPAGTTDFRLFEEVEQTTPQQQQRVRRQGGEGGGNNTEPYFVLVGTSHIGDSYSAILRHRSGNTIRVGKINPDGNTRIPDHQGYNIVHIGPGTVSIRYPDSDPCIDAPLKGVRCNQAVNIAALELANGEPIARLSRAEEQDLEARARAAAEAEAEDPEAQEEPANPFAQLRAAREANANSNNTQAPFNRRTIADEDIPPGMRRVSTPFGDRLVPQ